MLVGYWSKRRARVRVAPPCLKCVPAASVIWPPSLHFTSVVKKEFDTSSRLSATTFCRFIYSHLSRVDTRWKRACAFLSRPEATRGRAIHFSAMELPTKRFAVIHQTVRRNYLAENFLNDSIPRMWGRLRRALKPISVSQLSIKNHWSRNDTIHVLPPSLLNFLCHIEFSGTLSKKTRGHRRTSSKERKQIFLETFSVG